MNKRLYIQIAVQSFLNLIPIYGIYEKHWTLFSLIYLYWFETLIISGINLIKILTATGTESSDILVRKYQIPLANSKLGIAFRYIIARLFILAFYLVFIYVFIGLMATEKEDFIHNFQVVFFQDYFFNFTIYLFVLGQLIDYFTNFYKNNLYKNSHPSDWSSLIDARTIVIHVIIVLGVISYMFLKKDYPQYKDLPSLAFITIFVICKTLADIYYLWVYKKYN